MITPKEVEARRISDATLRAVVRSLTKNASDPARIGRRVLSLDYKLHRAALGEKLLTFAQRMNFSPARASQAVSEAEVAIFEIRNLNSNVIAASRTEDSSHDENFTDRHWSSGHAAEGAGSSANENRS